MKTNMRGLTLAAALLSTSPSVLAGPNDSASYPDSSAAVVGDLPGYGEDAYFAESASYAEASRTSAARPEASYNDHAQVAAQEPIQRVGDVPAHTGYELPGGYNPIPFATLQPGESYVEHQGSYEMACDGNCDGGCDSGCDGGRGAGRITKVLRGCDHGGWLQAESLLWFPQARRSPALVTTAAPGGFPILPNTAVAFGDEIDGGLSPGFRGDVGKYVGHGLGIGGRFWILDDNGDSYDASGDGTDQTIGRPFFNTDQNIEDALLVASTLGTGFTGSVSAESSLDMLAAEAYGRLTFGSGRDYHVDLIGGYTHFDIEDRLSITSTTVTNTTARARTFSDLFETENKFHGGQIGFESVINKGRWMARSLTKVHLGNMNQHVHIDGSSSDVTPPAAVQTFDRGLLALGNQGDYERDVFTFAPEVNFKLAYRFRPSVLLSVGYSFIYWDNLALAGEVIDRNIDFATVGNNNAYTARPSFDFVDSSLWVQGIDLGVIIDF